MSFTIDQLYALLPSVYRVRDAEQGYPLKALMAVLGEQVAVLEENLQQLYDDQFIETCADWVVPYIGALVGANGLNPPTSEIGTYDPLPNVSVSPRAVVANTIGYRRRKGTAVVLEQLARDVIGWDAHAVEFFQLLIGAQNVNHVRPAAIMSPDLRKWEPLQYIDTPFDTIPRLIDVRRIASKRGKYNIPNVGIFIWRIQSYPISNAPAYAVDASRFKFSALGIDAPLYTAPRTETEFSQLVQPIDAPLQIQPLILNAHLSDYYGNGLSIKILACAIPSAGSTILFHSKNQISVCSLKDVGATWGVTPKNDIYAVDPVLGRLLLAANAPSSNVQVSYHYGFLADIGGGEYGRVTTFQSLAPLAQVPEPLPTIQAGLDTLTGTGTLEITDSGTYSETPSLHVAAGEQIEIRAADLCRPVIALSGTMKLSGGANSELTLNGLVITGGSVQVTGNISKLTILHCSLVGSGSKPALVINAPNVTVEIHWSIIAGVRVANTATAEIQDSIVDSGAATSVAYAAPGNAGAGAPLTIQNVTVIGTVHTQTLELASNTIFYGSGAQAVLAEQLQSGCVRFSYAPLDPKRRDGTGAMPGLGRDLTRMRSCAPCFNSTQYGAPDYCQLSSACSSLVLTGSDDNSEMGVYHGLYQPQREANLVQQLGDYLRFGLEAGIFFAS